MRNFSKVLALVTGSLLIATAMTKPILGAEMEETEQSQPPPTSSQQPISPEELFQGLEERNLGTENTNLVGLQARLTSSENIESIIQDEFGDIAEKNSSQKDTAKSHEITKPIWVNPKSDGPVEDALNAIQYWVNRGFLLESSAEQKENDGPNILRPLAQRILNARQTELARAKTLFGAKENTESVKKAFAKELTQSQEKSAQELERFYQIVFHLQVIRDYTGETTKQIITLKSRESSSAITDQIKALQSSIYQLEALGRALYPYTRTRISVGSWLTGEHCTSQSRRLTLTGVKDNNDPFEISVESLEYKPFMEAVQALLYKQESPQLKDALGKRVFLDEKPESFKMEVAKQVGVLETLRQMLPSFSAAEPQTIPKVSFTEPPKTGFDSVVTPPQEE